MPEGDSVWRAARRLHAALSGRRVVRSDFRVPRHATADLRGALVVETVPRGKHLLTRFDGGGGPGDRITLHTHLRMDGSWTVLGPGKRLPRRVEPDARVLLAVDDGQTGVGLRLPVVELLPTREEHRVVGHLGPDLLGPDWDPAEAVRRLRADPDRPLAAALLDQRNLAGLGNLWVNELCFLRGHSPWTPVREVDLPAAADLAARMLRASISRPQAHQVTTGDPRPGQAHWVYGRAGEPCRRCGTPVAVAAEVPGDPERRRTWWCPHCQPGTGPGSGPGSGPRSG